MPAPPRLYAIADGDFLGLAAVAAAVAELAEAGFTWIQLRLKKATDAERWRLAEDCTRRLEGGGAALWIDDRVDLAMLLPFYGVHLGQGDLPPASARGLLGPARRIGLSTHDAEQCRAAEADEAVEVVAAGPIFPTGSKQNADPPLGLAGLRRLRGLTRKPLVAIGGIDGPRLVSVLEAGADTAVLLSALGRGREIGANARQLLRLAA
jgi:thiamine-phosphate pyrophosphorylase